MRFHAVLRTLPEMRQNGNPTTADSVLLQERRESGFLNIDF